MGRYARYGSEFKGDTALHLACVAGHIGVIRILLAHNGADVEVYNDTDNRTIYLGSQNGGEKKRESAH